MDRRQDVMPKKSASGTSASEFNINVPCFPSPPMFSSHSHLRHVLPQIPTRAGHPRMAVSKASTRDPFLGRMSEGDLFSDVITTHRLDDNVEQPHVFPKEVHDDSKFCDRGRPDHHKPSSTEGAKHMAVEQFADTFVEYSSEGDVKGQKSLVWEEDVDRYLMKSSSPSCMLNTNETTKRRRSAYKSPGTSEFAVESREPSAVTDSSDSGYVMNNSKSSKQSKLSTVVDSVLNPRSRYSKHRNPGMSSLFPMFDEDDSDDDNGSTDSPVAMNLSLATKSPLQSSPNTESLPRISATQQHASSSAISTGAYAGSPLDAILKMTDMINTGKKQSPSFTTNTDTVLAAGSFPQQFSTTFAPFQSRGDAWSQDARIFGSSSSPGMSYGKIAAEGRLNLPVAMLASGASDSAQGRNASQVLSISSVCASESQMTDVSTKDSAALLQTSLGESSETYEDSAHSRISDGNPIKLKIRRGAKGDTSQLSVVPSKRTKDIKTDEVVMKSGDTPARLHPSPLALSLLGAVPSPGTAPTTTVKSKLPAPGRAKTKGELKKQLIERKEQRLRNDSSQASSPAGSTMTPSPSHSQTDTLSPLSVNIDGGSATPQPSPQLSSGKTNVATVSSPTENVSITYFSVALSALNTFALLFNKKNVYIIALHSALMMLFRRASSL